MRWLFLFLLLSLTAHASDSNIASLKPVTAVGSAVSPAASNVTDGDSSTYTAPTTAGVIGFYYQIDLGQEYPLQAIDLYSRVNDGANKLSRVRMSVYSDNGGAPGVERWGYEIRADGSNNLQGGVDHLTADLHPAGIFRGRFIRLTNVGNTNTAPQIAEIEVFEAPRPTVHYFGTDVGNITKIGTPGMPTQATLTWNVAGFTSLSIDQGIGPVSGPSGSVVVSPNVLTTYTLTASNGAGQVTKTVTIGVDAVEQPPFLSEFLASNVGGIEDQFGNTPDWIEIGNPNPFSINLAGWYLTDSPVNLTRWQFPDFTIPGGGYAIVFASGNATSPPLQTPHTDFSLNTDGEFVGLVGRNGTTLVSKFPTDYPASEQYPPQTSDHSYGVTAGVPGFYRTPTPNAPNGARFDGIVAPLVFSKSRGFYSSPQSIEITCSTPGVQIRYTTNGAAPTESTGAIYSAPIPITNTTVLRAAAFRFGWAPTSVATHTYIFTAGVKASASSANGWLAPAVATGLTDAQADAALKQVPTMCITSEPGVTIDGGVDKLITLEWLDPLGGPDFVVPAGAQLFGGAFTNFAKKSYRISFKGEYGASKLRFPLFAGFDRGLAAATEFDQIELRNGSHDMGSRGFYLSNMFTDATMLDMGSFAPHGRWVHLYLNGAYWGLYHLRERWSADMMSSYYGGLDTDYESINGNLNAGGWADPGLPYDGTDAGWTRLKNLARSGPDTYAKMRPYLDVPQYVDYMIMWMFGKSEDEYRTTGPVNEGHGYKFLLNDSDGYLYYAPYGGPGSDRTARATPGKAAGDGPGSLFSMLFRDGGSEYRRLLADRIQRSFLTPGGAMTPARNTARLQELCAMIDQAFTFESARWNYMTPSAWATARDNAIHWFNGTGAGFASPRTTVALGHYTSAGFFPTLSAPTSTPAPGIVSTGTNVALANSSPGSSIFYTVNGPEPRQPGEPAPNAPLVTSASSGRYRVPTGATDGFTPASIPNLVAYWPMDGNTLDVVGGAHGTLTNGAFHVAPGRFGSGCVEFDGTNDYVAVGDPAGLKIVGQITIAAWVKLDSASGLRNIVNKGHDNSTTPNGEITLRVSSGAYQCGYWAGGLGTVIVSSPSSGANSAANDVGSWHHIASVWDGATWRLYRDGVQINSAASATGAVTVPNVGWAIGARGTGTERFLDGQVDEVRIYNRGLSATEILSLYNNTATTDQAIWAQTSFNDASWSVAQNGLGFTPVGDPLAAGVVQNIGPAMQGINASVLTRFPFSLTESERLATSLLSLKVRADDGYVAYLNGTRVASRNAPAPLNGTSASTAESPDATALAGETVDLTTSIPLLVNGTNVLAIHGLNLSAADNDALVSAELSSVRGIPGLSPTAVTYSAGAQPALASNSIVRTRSYDPATKSWSALYEVFYQVGPHPCPPGWLVCSELHYDPQGDDDGEFIELLNVGPGAVNLRGAKFTNGIDFTFPTNRDTLLAPGERLVLVDSALTFQRVQGWQQNFGGIYNGNLSNSGERITLRNADGSTILLDFTYQVTDPWPLEASSAGRSLVLIHPRLSINMSLPTNWRASRGEEGNPNGSDALSFVGNPDADLDGDGLTAVMEWGFGTSDLVPNLPPIETNYDLVQGFQFTVDEIPGTDSAALTPEATIDLSLWDFPLVLAKRELLPSGAMRSTWKPSYFTEQLFIRIRQGP